MYCEYMEAKYIKYKRKYLLAKHQLRGGLQQDSEGDVIMSEAAEHDEDGNIVRPPPPPQPDQLRRQGDGFPYDPVPLFVRPHRTHAGVHGQDQHGHVPVPDANNNGPEWLRYLNRQLPQPDALPMVRLGRRDADQLDANHRRQVVNNIIDESIRELINGIRQSIRDDLINQIPDDLINQIHNHTMTQLLGQGDGLPNGPVPHFPNLVTMDRNGIRHTIVRIIRDFLTQRLSLPQR